MNLAPLQEIAVIERRFDLASFYERVEAAPKERNALRQALVRGLKDYFESVYGYDRYGAETIFHLEERLGVPYIYGYAAWRALHDRRLSDATKLAVSKRALDIIEYGTDSGLPYGLYAILLFLLQHGQLLLDDLRYALVVSAGEYHPFRGLDRAETVDMYRRLLAYDDMPVVERVFWGHSLLARHQDEAGAAEMINLLLGDEAIPGDQRREVARAWINFRQPRLTVEVPRSPGSPRGDFVADHLGFWIAHAPSWPSTVMVRLGLVWLARLGQGSHQGWDPLELATTYMAYRDTFAEQLHAAVADIIAEHHASMPTPQVRQLIEQGITMGGSIPTRRRFYRLGTDLFGPQYLERATTDTANSVRQWAARQLQKQP